MRSLESNEMNRSPILDSPFTRLANLLLVVVSVSHRVLAALGLESMARARSRWVGPGVVRTEGLA